jgi:hypothetical protein
MGVRKLTVFVAALLAIGLAYGEKGIGIAGADEMVELRVSTPSDHPGVFISGATFTKDGTPVGQLGGWLYASGGGEAAATATVSEEPNDVHVDYLIVVGGVGATTTYIVSPADFGFGIEYFLPKPSPGSQTGPGDPDIDPDTDAYFVVSQVEDFDDDEPPICDFGDSSTTTIKANIQDAESGLAELQVRYARNVTVDPDQWPGANVIYRLGRMIVEFPPGTTSADVEATVNNTGRTAKLYLMSTDVAGNYSYCKKVQRSSSRSRSRSYSWSF